MFQTRGSNDSQTGSSQHTHSHTQKPQSLQKLKFSIQRRLLDMKIDPNLAIAEVENFAQNLSGDIKKSAESCVIKLRSLNRLWGELLSDKKRRDACIHIVTRKAGSRSLNRFDLYESNEKTAA